MPSKLTADFSKFPEPVRDAFPFLAGEAIELRSNWEIYHRLFMSDRTRTETLAEKLGLLLGKFQFMLQDELFLGIARLTDKSTVQENLSLRILKKAIPSAKKPEFRRHVSSALAKIEHDAAAIIKHRHKRIAHFDLEVSLDSSLLPSVTLQQIHELIEAIEKFLNLFYAEFEDTTMLFDLCVHDITGPAERSVCEAKAYALLEKAGRIRKGTWVSVMEGKPIPEE